MRITFGKYIGEDLEDVPCDYLQWLYDNYEAKDEYGEELLEAVDEEIQYREDNGMYIPGDYECYD